MKDHRGSVKGYLGGLGKPKTLFSQPYSEVLRVWRLGLEVPGLKQDGSGFGVQVLGFRVQGLGFRVRGLGFRVQGLGFRVQGLGPRV